MSAGKRAIVGKRGGGVKMAADVRLRLVPSIIDTTLTMPPPFQIGRSGSSMSNVLSYPSSPDHQLYRHEANGLMQLRQRYAAQKLSFRILYAAVHIPRPPLFPPLQRRISEYRLSMEVLAKKNSTGLGKLDP